MFSGKNSENSSLRASLGLNPIPFYNTEEALVDSKNMKPLFEMFIPLFPRADFAMSNVTEV